MNFWWGFDDSKRHFHPNSWDSICVPKDCGGLGLRRMEEINRVLVAKLGWEKEIHPDRLWVRALQTKYYLGVPFRSATNSSGGSWIWQGIMKTRDIVMAGLCWCIQNGANINIWCVLSGSTGLYSQIKSWCFGG